ncbi:MAG: Uma2 family endonuclease [Candidatus Eremiobacterota bacterium]
MEGVAKKTDKYFTYADYLTWPDEERWEIIEGIPFSMSAPSDIHQKVLRELLIEFGVYLRGKTCQIFSSPFDISLPQAQSDEDDNIYTVVQPDLVVICDNNKISRKGCKGAPDIVIEILSPSTASKDCIRKRELYEKHKVKQYWIIEPEEKEVFIFKLTKDFIYRNPEKYKKDDRIKVEGFEGLEIDLNLVFG